ADEVRPRLGEILAQLVDALGERGAESAVYADEGLETREGVREREEEEVHLPFRDRVGLSRRLEGGEMIAVALDHALGRPRGPRGVDDGCHVIGLDALYPRGQLGLESVGLIAAEPAGPLPRHATPRP